MSNRFRNPLVKLSLGCLLVFSLSVAGIARARAWGSAGHHDINGLAVDCLPAELRPLYAANRDWIVFHGMDPDNFWRSDSRAEGPHHFIDLDTWGMDAALSFPHDYWTACGLYGQAAIDKNGVVPWRVGQFYGRLVRAFKEHDARAIVEMSAWMGHYGADIHVPFHAAANYDGQLSGQKGIHARFESVMVERQIKPSDLHAHPAQRLADPVASCFQWLRASLAAVPAVLDADKAAVQKDPAYGDAYYTVFGETARPIAVRRLEEGAQDVASLWYSAWLDAGKPTLPAASDVHTGELLDKRTTDPFLSPAEAPAQPAK